MQRLSNKSATDTTTIQCLPSEIHTHIIKFTPWSDIISVCLTCKQFYNLYQDLCLVSVKNKYQTQHTNTSVKFDIMYSLAQEMNIVELACFKHKKSIENGISEYYIPELLKHVINWELCYETHFDHLYIHMLGYSCKEHIQKIQNCLPRDHVFIKSDKVWKVIWSSIGNWNFIDNLESADKTIVAGIMNLYLEELKNKFNRLIDNFINTYYEFHRSRRGNRWFIKKMRNKAKKLSWILVIRNYTHLNVVINNNNIVFIINDKEVFKPHYPHCKRILRDWFRANVIHTLS